ncbi:MAG: ATP-binding protein [Anaerolineae bacterium]|nr:ATP-binding protein [Anaerolineae bacterium]
MDDRVENELVHNALRLKAVLENVPVATLWVADAARDVGLDRRTVSQIELAVDEACANVVEHAYAGLEAGEMEVACALDIRGFVVRVRDWGTGFDPEAVDEPDVTAPLEERDLGGLGLFLVRQAMDEVEFHCNTVHGNELVMVKRLEGGR